AHLLAGAPAPADERVGASAPTPAPPTVAVPDEVAALGAFVGTWIGAGEGFYPTIADFGYTEEIELRPVPGKPLLAYRSSTRARDDGRALHSESGFLRLVGDGLVELVLAHGSGVVEVDEGVVDGDELVLTSPQVTRTSTAKLVEAVERRYRIDG